MVGDQNIIFSVLLPQRLKATGVVRIDQGDIQIPVKSELLRPTAELIGFLENIALMSAFSSRLFGPKSSRRGT